MQAGLPSGGDAPVRLVCAEVWGGNRAVFRPVELPGIRGVLFSWPSDGGRGGDVHYLSVCGSGLLSRMCIADVAGHGASVASISGELHAMLRRLMNQPDQRRVLAGLNRRLDALGLRAMTTAAAISYYPLRRSLSVSYAGHPPAWLYDAASRDWRRLELPAAGAAETNLPLGVLPQTQYTRRTTRVNVGDRMLVVSDGVLEAPSTSGELFGAEGVESVLADGDGATLHSLATSFLERLRAHTGRESFTHDDVTFLLIEVVAGPRGPAIWHALRNRIVRPRGQTAVD